MADIPGGWDDTRVNPPMPLPRVLILTAYYHPVIGGVETHARDFVRFLRDRGVAVTVVTKQIDDTTPRYEHLDGVPVHRVPPRGQRTRAGKWLMIPFAAAALVTLRDSYDVVYCPDIRGLGLAACAVRLVTRRPVVAQVATPRALSSVVYDAALRHGTAPERPLARVVKWPIRRLYTTVDAVVCLSREIEHEAYIAGFVGEKVKYLPHWIDLDRFRPPGPGETAVLRSRLGLPPDQLICLFLGRLSREKGVLDLLTAWQRIHTVQAVLVLAGPDMPGHPLDAGAEARRLAAGAGLEGRVRFLGPVADPAPLLRAVDVFAQPSHYEAFSISPLEAIASGLPVVVTTRVGGMIEYLMDGRNAMVCEPRDPTGLAERLRQLLADEELRRRLAAAARHTAEREFDRSRLGEQYLDLLVGAAPRARAG